MHDGDSVCVRITILSVPSACSCDDMLRVYCSITVQKRTVVAIGLHCDQRVTCAFLKDAKIGAECLRSTLKSVL